MPHHKTGHHGLDIDALHLADAARQGAVALQTAFPGVVFTSGRRTRGQQAAAMARNIVKSGKRSWIGDAYKPSATRNACQRWVDDNPDATTAGQLTAGLFIVLQCLSDKTVGEFSKHLVGLAFDVQPVARSHGGADIKAAIKALPGLTKFIQSESGVTVWHAQFG